MKYLLLIILLLATLYHSTAQHQNVWAFGNGAGLDFNSGSPLPINTSMNSIEACASVCDAEGQLLFYTDGSYIWDHTGTLMPNGSDLTPFPSFSGSAMPTASTAQGALIIPDPGNLEQYYVFSNTCFEMGEHAGRLYYSKVNMNLNGGMGDVMAGQKGILLDSLLTEQMNGVAGDQCNFWAMVCSQDQLFKAYEITASGVNTVPVLSPVTVDDVVAYNFQGGNLVFSPDRHKLAISVSGYISYMPFFLYDFDPLTGIVSNPISINRQPSSNTFISAYGICFSPDNSKLYISFFLDSLYQFDLTVPTATAILNSKLGVGISDMYGASGMKYGPDNKLYLRSASGSFNSLSVIHHPNIPGAACGFVEDAIPLIPGSSMAYTLPTEVPVIKNVDTTISLYSDTAGCFAPNAEIAAGNAGGYNYEWNTGATTVTITADNPGTYWVRYHTSLCSYHIDTIDYTMPYGTLPAIHIDTACAGTATGGAYANTYPGDTVHYAYTWLSGEDTLSTSDTLAAAPAGNYTLLVHTASCDTNLNFVIPEVDYQVNFDISDTLLCIGDTLYVHNTSAAHFSQFTWYFGDGDSSLLTLPPGHPYPHPGSYEIMLTGSGTVCQDTLSRRVIIDSMVVPVFLMDAVAICVGEPVIFKLQDADTSFTGLRWNWGDGSYLNADYENNFTHAFDQPGVWPVQVTLEARVCPDTAFTDTVRVYALPEVNLGSDTNLCLDGHALVLNNLSPAPNEPYHYLWSTGDTTAGLRVLQPGSYSLRVTTEPLGCNTTDELVVTKDCYTDIPNAFTPNGDGDNDYFFPRTQLSKSVNDFKMQVFNRWGQLVFETTKVEGRGWDGRFNEKEQPLGVYIYVMDVIYVNGRQERYEGNVTLIR